MESVDNTLGAGFVGDVAASILFGISCTQCYYYYVNYPKDWMFQKIAVGILMYAWLNRQSRAYSHPQNYSIWAEHILIGWPTLSISLSRLMVVWSFKLQMALNVFIVVTVQSLYALRVWKLGGYFSRSWPIAVLLFVVAGLVIGIILVVETYRITEWHGLHRMSWSICASFSISTVIDIALAISMCYYLNKARTGFSGTNNTITLVMHYVLISGSLTSACSLTALICYVTMDNLIFLGVSFLLTKLYINSYLSMLNSRSVMRNSSSNPGAQNFGAGSIMNLRNMRPQVSVSTRIETTGGSDGEEKDSVTGYAVFTSKRDEEGMSTEDSTNMKIDGSGEGIIVHRLEERRYDEDHV